MSGAFEGLRNAPVAAKLILSLGIPAALAIGIGIALAFVKKVGLLTLLLYICNLIITFIIFQVLPDFVRAGGPLVGALIFVFILLITYIVERFFTLSRSKGKGSMQEFTRSYMHHIGDKSFDAAIVDCDAQGGSAATILKGAIQQVVRGSGDKAVILKTPLEIRRIFEEAVSRETPLLERNLIAITTIASIATMIGLLGTTIGMIRAFQAMAHAGAPDAIMLATGISEALFNTAGGLGNAIIGIIANNYFVNRVDRFTYEINELVYDTVDVFERMSEKK
ncbi:MAG TPA: MotA/TolQ/ExbB proton channel family protein [bacterium]